LSSFDLDFEKVGNDSYFLTGGTPFEKLNIDWLAPNMLLPGFDPF
jgi:rubredoxin